MKLRLKINDEFRASFLSFFVHYALISLIAENVFVIVGISTDYVRIVNYSLIAIYLLITFFYAVGTDMRITMVWVFAWIAQMGIYLYSRIITPQIDVILIKAIAYTFVNVFVTIFWFVQIENYEVLVKHLFKYVKLSIVASVLQLFAYQIKNQYSMNFSYAILLSEFLLLFYAKESGKIKYWIGFAFLFGVNVLVGSRGSIICIFIGIGLYFVIFQRISKKMIVMGAGVITVGCIAVLKIREIFILLAKFFPFSRTIQLFAMGDFYHLSGRQIYYTNIINKILQDNFKFHGLLSDRVYMSNYISVDGGDIWGIYSHNIFLEIVYQFGFLGVIFCFVGIVILVVSMYKVAKYHDRSLIILYTIFCSWCFGQLLVSGSYLSSNAFGAYIGVILSMHIMRKRQRIRRQSKVGNYRYQ